MVSFSRNKLPATLLTDIVASNALTLLFWHQEWHLANKKWVMRSSVLCKVQMWSSCCHCHPWYLLHWNTEWFLPHDAMLAWYLLSLWVHPSVCLSQVGVLWRWLNVGSHKQHYTIAKGL